MSLEHLNEATARTPTPRPALPFEAAVASEIAARFVEWAEFRSRPEVENYIRRIAGLLGDPAGPAGFWIFMRLSTGDMAALTMSYAELGDMGARSKQAVQQEFERAMHAISYHFPEAERAIKELRVVHEIREENKKCRS